MFYLDSYHTTIGSIFDTKGVIAAIRKTIIMDGVEPYMLDVPPIDGITPLYIQNVMDSQKNISLFNHTLYFEDDKKKYLVTDLRMVLKKDSVTPDNIKNVTEYNFLKSRSILNLHWIADNATELMITLPFAGFVYSMWISDMLAKAFVLDHTTKEIITIASNLFYQSLFFDEITEKVKEQMTHHTIMMTKADTDLVFSIIDQLDGVSTISEFALKLKDITGSSRLKDLNIVSLLTILRNSWFGNNAKDILGVSLESPPTWMALVFTALTERNYKNSTIAKLAEMLGGRGRSVDFVNNFKMIMDGSVSMEDLSYTILD